MDLEALRRMAELQRVSESLQRTFEAAANIQKLYAPFAHNPYGVGPSPKIERKWSVWTDPNIPGDFKTRLKRRREDQRFVERIDRFMASLSSAGSCPNSVYSVTLNVVCHYLQLVEGRFDQGLGPVPKGELSTKVIRFHEKQIGARLVGDQARNFKKHLARIFNELGLNSLPELLRGRPKK